MTADELGDACTVARVTAAKSPAASVSGALSWYTDGRVLKIGERYHLVSSLLDGRWLTMSVPDDPMSFTPGLDLQALVGTARRDGIPLRAGGRLYGQRHGSWHGPPGWAPGDELVGVRLVGGVAEVAAVTLDDAARERGLALAERIIGSRESYLWYSYDAADNKVRALLALCAEDDDLLREPVAPLGVLLPAPEPRRSAPAYEPLFPTAVSLDLPPGLRAVLEDVASDAGQEVGPWIVAQLERLSSWPYRPERELVGVVDRYGNPYADPDAGLSVVAMDGWRRGPGR